MFPAHGRPVADVLAELEARQAGDVDWRGGRVFSLAYDAGDVVHDLAVEAASRFLSVNALNPAAFPSVGEMQREVVAMMSDLLHGGSEASGFMTSGGTESILLAVKAAKKRGQGERGIDRPNLVLPASAHAAFTKGADYFDVEIRRIPVGDDFRADVGAMAGAIDDQTVLVVGSAPQYPQGVIDPIGEIAALAIDSGCSCHVDACMGGVTLPMLERLGHDIPPFDFRVPGVTSMSVDLHKYGYSAKGASVILYRDKHLRRYQTFATDDWLGGLYASSGILGTKSGGPIASAWAVMTHLGAEGYERLTAAAREATLRLSDGLSAIPAVEILAPPEATLVAFRMPDLDTFAVGNALSARGWYCDQQAPPPSLHCMVNAVHAAPGRIEEFVAAVDACCDEIAASSGDGRQAAYGSLE